MKTFVIAFLTLVLIACHQPANKVLLIGEWKTTNVLYGNGMENYSDCTWFMADGSMKAEVYSGDSVVQSLNGVYSWDARSEKLVISYEGYSGTCTVVKLSESVLILKNDSMGTLVEYVRRELDSISPQ